MKIKSKIEKRVKKIKEEKENKDSFIPYEEENEIEKLILSIVIVPRHHGKYFVEKFFEKGISASFRSIGRGTAPSELEYVLGISESRKDIVFTIFKESQLNEVDAIIDERFKVSKASKGISFIMKLDSIIGVLPYKFFTDTKVNRRKNDE